MEEGCGVPGVRHAIAYALEGTCDAHLPHSSGADALEAYGAASDSTVARFIVDHGHISADELTAGGLRVWTTGHDPDSGEERGAQRLRPDADLVFDCTLNHPKSYSIAALLHPDLADEFEALQDRLRDHVMLTWQRELNARRGHGGLISEPLTRVEVVELQHRRSRALDPHAHRHLWLNAKVLGEDGKWSNVDSRVAMRFQTVINAEGDLLARTDPQWLAALALHGFTLDEHGEIAQLAAAVPTLSRRSAQIEKNRRQLLEHWTATHGGATPSVNVLQQVDRRAWALSRPNKPKDLDEQSWEATVRDELLAIDPTIASARPPVAVVALSLDDLDVDLLADAAIVDADRRSPKSHGRFSMFDLRAGAIRALSRGGVVAARDALTATLDDVSDRARQKCSRLLSDAGIPDHLKVFMATETVRLKMRLAARMEGLAASGRSLSPDEVRRSAASTEGLSSLEESQIAAAGAIAGWGGLVAVTGPAGAGKTTMLRVAHAALIGQRRRMLVVAPTRKAASVASREVGAAASSLHALLADHGYRWRTDPAERKCGRGCRAARRTRRPGSSTTVLRS